MVRKSHMPQTLQLSKNEKKKNVKQLFIDLMCERQPERKSDSSSTKAEHEQAERGFCSPWKFCTLKTVNPTMHSIKLQLTLEIRFSDGRTTQLHIL